MADTKDLEQYLKQNSQPHFEKLPVANFVNLLETYMESHSMSKAELIRSTLLDRNYAYQIFSGQKIPSKKKIVQMALAMHLSLEETNRLLALCDHGFLYVRIPADAVYIFCLEHHKSVMECNELLNDNGLSLLDQ